MIQRLDQLTAPVEVGTMYLVPTVFGEWDYRGTRWWPVIGPQHHDKQCLNFEWDHYHLDARFFPARNETNDELWRNVFARPMSVTSSANTGGFPAPVWRRRICRRLANPYLTDIIALAAQAKNWQCHFDMWTGRRARHDGRGWICPHRSVSLADHAAVDGVITCPLHLLRIEAETGRVLPPIKAHQTT